MDDISLVVHMGGEGPANVHTLRRAGYTSLKKIIEENPKVMCEKTGLKAGPVRKIMNAARILVKPRPEKARKILHEKAKKRVKKRKKTKKGKRVRKQDPSKKNREIKTISKDKRGAELSIKTLALELMDDPEIMQMNGARSIKIMTKNREIKEKIFAGIFQNPEFKEKLGKQLVRELLS